MFFNLRSKNNYILSIIVTILLIFLIFLITVIILKNFIKNIRYRSKVKKLQKELVNLPKNKESLKLILNKLKISSTYQLAKFIDKSPSFVKENQKNYTLLVDLINKKLK